LRPDFELCLGLHEDRHDVSHFGNATGRGVFTDAGHAVFAGCEDLGKHPFIHSFEYP